MEKGNMEEDWPCRRKLWVLFEVWNLLKAFGHNTIIDVIPKYGIIILKYGMGEKEILYDDIFQLLNQRVANSYNLKSTFI